MPSSPLQTQDESAVISSSPIVTHGVHALCPPEEREPDAIGSESSTSDRAPHPLSNEDETEPQTTEVVATEIEPGTDEAETPESVEQRMKDVDEALLRDAPSSPTTKDSDIRLAQSMSATALSPPPPTQVWPTEKESNERVLPNHTCSFLRPGSKFVGTQQSDRQRYNVQVEIKNVNMEESFLCGYLRIQGLTDDHPTLTTYFEGEIIGNKHTFKTAHPEWGSCEKTDMQHWARFPAWRPLHKQAKSANFTFKDFAQREHIFMRWKEYFLVPDHKVKTITGASFEGFYYICFNQCSGSVSGIYYHAKSEKYQQLELEHVKDRGCMGAMEFR